LLFALILGLIFETSILSVVIVWQRNGKRASFGSYFTSLHLQTN
jgi:hypothetical protein